MKTINELSVKQFRNERVLTTYQLAGCYNVNPQRIQQNYNNNKDRFKFNNDFFIVSYSDIEYSKFSNITINKKPVYLWTERGCFKHAKSLNNDIAWLIYENLLENYFRVKGNIIPINENDRLQLIADQAVKLIEKNKEIALLEASNQEKNKIIEKQLPAVEFKNAISNTPELISIGKYAKVLPDCGEIRLFSFLRNIKILQSNKEFWNEPYQKYIESKHLKLVEKMRKNKDTGKYDTPYFRTYITGKGQKYIYDKWMSRIELNKKVV